MPYIVLVGVEADAPPEDDGLETPLVDKLVNKCGPLDGLYVDLYSDHLEPPLYDRCRLEPCVVSHVGDDGKLEWATITVEEAVAIPVLPPRLFEEPDGPLLIIAVLFYLAVVGPRPRHVWAGRRAPQPQEDAIDEFLFVDPVGQRLSHPLVGKEGAFQIKAKVGVGGDGVAVLPETLPEDGGVCLLCILHR